jgi:hypothetical protein
MDKEEMGILREVMGVMGEEELVRVRYRLRKAGKVEAMAVLDEEIRWREEEGRE